MSQEFNDLFSGITEGVSSAELSLITLQGLISGEIASQRIKRGLNQKQFAELMGVSQSRVSKWEKGECNFTIATLVSIADKLGLSLRSPFDVMPHTDIHKRCFFPGEWNSVVTPDPKPEDYNFADYEPQEM